MWSSLNSLTLYDIVVHYLTTDYTTRTILINLKRIRNTHSDENITDIVLNVIREYQVTEKVDYFQTDNADNNDICVQAILDVISPESESSHRQIRYYGHIINFAIKTFLFDSYLNAFEFKINNFENLKLEIRYKQELLNL